VVGEHPGRALRVASLIGYVLVAPVLFLLYAGLALAGAALVTLVIRPSRGDPCFSLMKAAIAGSIVLLLLANNPRPIG
jgi:hypothetical protein